MASSRVARVWCVVVATAFAAAATPRAALASCKTSFVPPVPRYYGWIGHVDRPFAVSGEDLNLGRSGCDPGGPFSVGVLPRTFFVVDPTAPGDKRSILIVEPGSTDQECRDAEAACKAAAPAGLVHEVKCVLASTLREYRVVSPELMKLAVPDAKQKAGLAVDGGPVTVAMTDRVSNFGACKELATANACRKFDKTTDTSWKACIDTFFREDKAPPACAHTETLSEFPSLTLLPPWNAFDDLCFEQKPYCKRRDDALEFRYAVDDDENIVIPVDWQGALAHCGGPGACGLEVAGALIAPNGRDFDLPRNRTGSMNDFLESFTPEGLRNTPEFFAKAAPKAGVIAVAGRTDEPTSVLRVRSSVKQCFRKTTPTGQGCRRHGECGPGEKCWAPCLGGANAGIPCDKRANVSACLNAKGRCGRAHDMVDAHVNGRWFLKRDDGAFCEAATINKLCAAGTPCPSGTPCVRYEAVAGKPFTPTPKPAETPDDGILAGFQSLVLDKLGASLVGANKAVEAMTVLQFARSQNRRWVAGVVAVQPRGVGSGSPGPFLVVASRQCTEGITVCDPRVVKLANPPLNREPAFHDDQLRFLTHDPDAGPADTSGSTRNAVLWIAGLSRSTCCDPLTPVRVGRVLLDNPEYDALSESSRGGTVYLAPGGRCFEQEVMLMVPSYCRPAERDCPDGAECRPTPVAVAIDLKTDLNDDGIPDSLQQRGQ